MLLIIFFRLLIVFTTIGLVFRAMDLGGILGGGYWCGCGVGNVKWGVWMKKEVPGHGGVLRNFFLYVCVPLGRGV